MLSSPVFLVYRRVRKAGSWEEKETEFLSYGGKTKKTWESSVRMCVYANTAKKGKVRKSGGTYVRGEFE